MIPLAEPMLDGNEARYVQECIESGYVSSVGPFVDRFEREFAEKLGVEYAIACSSGTAALHIALILAGAMPGKLVALSDFTFIASANAAMYTGADCLLVDSESATWNMDTEMLHDEIMRRSRTGGRLPDVIEIVHILGHPANLEPLLDIQWRFNIPIVEDAAESLGARWVQGTTAGSYVGTVGNVGCFSFNGNKLITTGSGGMIVTASAEIASRARHLINQAKVGTSEYIHDAVGYNYRLSNIAAAVGLAQMERITVLLNRKRQLADRYGRLLAHAPLTLPPKVNWADPSSWLYSLLFAADAVDVRNVVREGMEMGIELRRLWPPLHSQAPYRCADRLGGSLAEQLYRRGISIPSSPGITAYEQSYVTETITAMAHSRRRRSSTICGRGGWNLKSARPK